MARVEDMTLIDATKFAPNGEPKVKDLDVLKRYVKQNYFEKK